MVRENEAVIDLGVASVETQGPGGKVDDQVLGIPASGLSND